MSGAGTGRLRAAEQRPPGVAERVHRASRLHARGMEANDQMRPTVGARELWAALELLDGLDGTGTAEVSDLVAARNLRGRIRVSLAFAEAERGDVELGLRLLADAEPDLPRSELGLLQGQRGILLRRSGRDGEAAAAYGRALAALDPDSQPLQYARVRLNRSMMHLAAVHLEAARADLDSCLTIAGAHDLPLLAAKARHNLGLLDFVAGDLPSALGAFRVAAAEYTERAPGMLPQLSLDRARALVAAGLLTEAEAELRQVVRRLAGQRLEQDLAEAHLALAEVALLAERPADVRPHARRALVILRRRGNLRWAARARLLELRAALLVGRSGSLTERFQALATDCRAVGLAEEARVAEILAGRSARRAGAAVSGVRPRPRIGDRLDTRLLWSLTRAEADLAAGRTGQARRTLARGLAELHQQRGRMGAVDLRSGAAVHGRALARLGLESAVRDGRPAAILHWSELSRAQALLLPPVRPPAEPEVAAALAELRGLDVSIAERQDTPGTRGLADLQRRRNALRQRVREHSWSVGGATGRRRAVGIGEVRAALGDAALVSYLDLPGRMAALVVTGRRAEVVSLGRPSELREPLRRLRVDLDVAAGRRLPAGLAAAIAASTERDGAALSARLIEPMLGLVGDRDLVVVPTGPLFSVPWAALPPLAGRPVSVGLSATSWLSGRGRTAELVESLRSTSPGPSGARDVPASEDSDAWRALAVSGPRIGHGEREVAEVAGRLATTEVLSGSAATVDRVLGGLARVRLAHLASHGHHAGDNALFSGLELADGTLMGYDIQRLPSVPALVVLSACDVGQSEIAPGDESLGMVTAFAAAGSGAVVAAVCRVGDELAPAVMRAFYDGLVAGRGPARALADAGTAAGVTGFVCFGAG